MPGTPASSRGGSAPDELVYTEFVANVAITATVEANADVIVTAAAYTFDGATIALIEFFAQKGEIDASASAQLIVNLFEDGVDIGRIAQIANPSATGTSGAPVYAVRRRTPASGARTYSARGWITAAGTATVQAGAGGAATSVPGFIRIVTVPQ